MRKIRIAHAAALIAVGGTAMLSLAACGITDKYVATGADEYDCVYNVKDGGFRLTHQLTPSTSRTDVGNSDHTTLVTIPASFRFYNMTNDNNRDPRAPQGITSGYAGGVQMNVEVQLRFRFNLAQACDWYAKHGRRNAGSNGSLGFNARGVTDQNAPGWFDYLSENFAPATSQAVKALLPNYSWQALTLNYPINADPDTGKVPDGQKAGTPAQDALASALVPEITTDLKNLVAGTYFCGTTSTTTCAPIDVFVQRAEPVDPDFAKQVAALATTKQALETQQAQAQLQQQNQASQIAQAKTNELIYAEQLKAAQIKGQLDFSECAPYAAAGLDCKGNKQPIYVNGVPTAGTASP